jgi:serine protease Do
MRRYRKQILLSIFVVVLMGLFVGAGLINAAPADKEITKSDKAWLGIYMQNLNKDIAEAMDLDVDRGVLVNDVVDDSPADKAGLEDGDVIIRFGDNVVDNTSDLSKAVKSMKPGDKVELVIYHDGTKKDLKVVMGAASDRSDQVFSLKDSKDKAMKMYKDALELQMKPHGYLGVTLEPLGEQLAEYFGVKDGVLITEVEKDSPAAKAGLKAGDVILSINGEETTSPSDVSSIIRKQKEGDKVDLLVSRKGKEMTIAAQVEEREMSESLFGFFGPWDSKPNVMVLPDFEGFEWKHDFKPDEFIYENLDEYKGELREQLQELREQLQEMREELNELREELK